MITNIAAYRFAPLSGLPELRTRLTDFCRPRELKGTILLSPEGINLFVAGAREAVEALLAEIRSIPGLEPLEAKFSQSEHQPFNRMLVRLKREIIAFGVPGISPAKRTSPKLPPQTLKQWLDEGRDVVLLDTRNDYEVKLGTFTGALTPHMTHFRQFPQVVSELEPELKKKTVVMFCTGGIRCEKAGPYMEREGFESIYQLEGGILKYFEECGGAHYEGECFVFDQRVGVDPQLAETASDQCFACQAPLRDADLTSEKYRPGQSCPYCYQDAATQQQQQRAKHQAALDSLAQALPGSQPYDNYRPVPVTQDYDGWQLLPFLTHKTHWLTEAQWREICAQGRLLDERKRPLTPQSTVRAGQKLLHLVPGQSEPPVNAAVRILHEDSALIIVDKPAPLPMHPCGRYNRNTLQYLLSQAYWPEKPKPAHRLDANTTGVVVLGRTRHFVGRVQDAFKADLVEKTYLARVQGHPAEKQFRCTAPICDDPGPAGRRSIDFTTGQPSETLFTVRELLADGTAWLECRPLTGRTNQIRLHLWHLGIPILGDTVYLPQQALGVDQTLDIGAPRLWLHAWKIAFPHPLTKERLEFQADPPCI